MSDDKKHEIRRLNDLFRKNPLAHGKLVVTAAVHDKGPEFIRKCLETIKHYDAFTPDNDPHGEGDMCVFEVDGETVWLKIDYMDQNMEYGSEDPADRHKTVRLGTILFPSDY
jgi:hypothetical protein